MTIPNPPPENGAALQPPPPPPEPLYYYPYGPQYPIPAQFVQQWAWNPIPPEYQGIPVPGAVTPPGQVASPTQGVREQQLAQLAADLRATEERQRAEADRIAREVEEREASQARYAAAYARALEEEERSQGLTTLLVVVGVAFVLTRLLR